MNTTSLFSAGLIALSLSSFAAEGHHHWSYVGAESPAHWGDLSGEYSACKVGTSQSPVDIAATLKPQPGKGVITPEYRAANYQLENNGHTLQASPSDNTSAVNIDGNVFTLKQFHFHTPSEHTFKGKHFPMEIHFVHQTEKGELAVLAVMVREGAENPALSPLTAKKLASGEKERLPDMLNPQQLLPQNRLHFRLSGSLTTPPCSEGVTWIIFETPIEAGRAQIAAIHEMIGDNNRPLQPLNSRTVEEEN